ncbi:MAG: phospholipase D-like domain-containing protein [Prochlorococcaceae cyanobacterium]
MPRLLLLLLSLGLGGCAAQGSILGLPPAEPPLPAGIQVAFNHRQGRHYRSPISAELREGDNLEAMVLQAIASARSEVLVAVQELSLPKVAEALAARHRAGLRVRVVLENTYSTPWSEQHAADLSPHLRLRWQQLSTWADRNGDGQLAAAERRAADAVAILRDAGVPMLDDTADGSAGSGLMHHKFMVVDRRLLVTGSANFTPSCIHGDADDPRTRGNVNHLLRFESAALAGLFAAEFERMWGDGPGGQPDSRFGLGKQAEPVQQVMVGSTAVEVLFAPHPRSSSSHGLALIGERLAAASRQLDLALFVFSAQNLADVLAERVAAGVSVRLLADPGFASRSFSEVLDLLGVSLPDRFCKLERGNAPWRQPLEAVGTPRLAGGDKLHHKFAVLDNRTVITGSFNWSPSAAHQNDETLLLIHSPQLAAHFGREVDRLWSGSELGVGARLQRKLAAQARRCGSGTQRT